MLVARRHHDDDDDAKEVKTPDKNMTFKDKKLCPDIFFQNVAQCLCSVCLHVSGGCSFSSKPWNQSLSFLKTWKTEPGFTFLNTIHRPSSGWTLSLVFIFHDGSVGSQWPQCPRLTLRLIYLSWKCGRRQAESIGACCNSSELHIITFCFWKWISTASLLSAVNGVPR